MADNSRKSSHPYSSSSLIRKIRIPALSYAVERVGSRTAARSILNKAALPEVFTRKHAPSGS
jgi:hypothetical protein